jgi:hypothetical protein
LCVRAPLQSAIQFPEFFEDFAGVRSLVIIATVAPQAYALDEVAADRRAMVGERVGGDSTRRSAVSGVGAEFLAVARLQVGDDLSGSMSG